MKVTVEDICNFPEFTNLKLIAGKEGINNVVEKCGILDYEFVDGVREKWYSTNFRQNHMIVVTSFLYAKDNEYLIMDAVKNLASRKCSGLIIKNIFHLPIHENVIRYADTMKFPLILVEGSNIHYEDLIVLISERVKQYESLHFRESKVDEIFRNGSNTEVCEKIAYEINPTFQTDMVAMFFQPTGEFTTNDYLEVERKIMDSNLLFASDSTFYYKGGFFIIHSKEMFDTVDAEKLCEPILEIFKDYDKKFRIGISGVHHLLWQIKNCLEESRYAARLKTCEDTGHTLYENLGIYKVILPYCDSSVMRDFSMEYIKPLEDYDLETKGNLLETAIGYVLNDGDIQKTADSMLQHKNTIRYRLKNISNILGMNIFETTNYEILSFAIRIYICNDGTL